MVLRCDRRDIFALFAMFERWRASENAVLIRQQIQAECSADPLLLCVFTAVLLTLSGRFSRPYRLVNYHANPLIKTLATARVKPFVSVVTPTWNRGAFPAVPALYVPLSGLPGRPPRTHHPRRLPQSHQHIIDHLTKGTPGSFNIRYIHHPEKLPLGKKRNMLNELARGEYILCMDDDDYYSPDKNLLLHRHDAKTPALISGSDQIPIWYSHINRIFKSRSFGPHNILNGTFCYHRNYLKSTVTTTGL